MGAREIRRLAYVDDLGAGVDQLQNSIQSERFQRVVQSGV